jgi:SAM-dependent methyltransferase
VRTREECLKYWRRPNDGKNDPEEYLLPRGRSDWLLKRLGSFLRREYRILEVGCNSGRNLDFLQERGYQNVYGIEVSPGAVAVLGREFPWLKAEGRITTGAAEHVLPGMSDGSFDVVLTMACLMHVHPDSIQEVCRQIGRVAGRLVVIAEPFEVSGSWRSFSRDYDGLFAGLTVEKACPVEGVAGLEGFQLRIYGKREEKA